MKKLLALLLALIMCLTVLTSCDAVKGVVDQIKDKIDSIIHPEEPVEYQIDKAEAFLKNMYKDVNPVTGADYEVVGQIRVANVAYTVTWASNSAEVKIVALENGNYLVDLNEKATQDTPYTLTATITAGNGDTATVVYERTIPQYNVLSWDAYMAAQKGDVVLVEGIVVAINAKSLGNTRNHLFLADASGKGGYYSYQMDEDPVEAGVKVGMTVSVSGPVEPYSGMQEIKGGTFAIVDETIKTVNPVDITDYILAGNTDFSAYVALPVTIKGVTISNQELETASSQYLNFEIAGLKSYVRTYVTDFPTTLDAKTATAENADKAAIDKAHADHFGYTADVTGILILYSGNPYLIPMTTDCFTNFQYVEKTAEEKVDAELGELKLETTVTSSTVVDILTTGKYYSDVTISWTSDSEYAVIDGNKLTLTVPNTGATAKVTATVTCGDVTKTKEFTIKLSMEPTAIAEIIEMALKQEHNVYTADKYIVAGVITEVYNTQYGNMKITDELGNILTIYGTYGADGVKRYDALESKPVAGDYVVVLGVVGHYNGTPQVKNGWILTFTTPTSIESANTIGAAKEHNTYTEEKHLVTGVVTEVKNTQYGNLYIQDEAGNKIYIYGLYDQAGNRYDAMVTAGHAPVVGDTITVLSVVGQYNGTVQLKNATVVVRTAPEGHKCANVCPACEKCTNADCTEDVCAEKCEGHVVNTAEAVALPDGTKVTVTGAVLRIDTAWSDQYGNITVTIGDAAGTLYVYRLATNVEVGQVITISGEVGSYKGAKQIAAGATATVDETHKHTFTEVKVDSTCVVAGTITYTCECGTTIVETLALAKHSANENSVWTTVEEAGCTTLGSEKTTCVVCGEADVLRDTPMVHTKDENGLCTVCNKWTFDATLDHGAMAAETKANGDTAVYGAFTIHYKSGTKVDKSSKTFADGYTATLRLNMGGKSEVKDGLVCGAVSFTVTEATTLKVWWVCGGDARAIGLYTMGEDGKLVAPTTTYGADSVKNSLYITEIEVPAAGTYYLGATGSNYYFKLELDGPASSAPVVNTVTYSFANTSTQKGVELTAETALALFNSSATENVLTSVEVTKIYDGNGTGGAYPETSGFLKAGSSKADGQIVLNFGDKKVTKVEIKCHDWYKLSDAYPTNSNKISVNGSEGVLVPYTADGTPDVITFTLDEASSVVTIDIARRAFIFDIVVTFE